jgi:broad specificity phosphatase PhoE
MSDLPTVYLARHGETEWSKSGQHTGRTDLPLTANGIDIAKQLKARLAGISFAHVFSSPLSRAKHTADLAGFANPVLDEGLYEWDYGRHEGLKSAEIAKIWPGWNLFRDGAPGGESPEQVTARADALVKRLKGLSGNVICFAHGHILRVIAARWIEFPIQLGSHMLLGTATLSVLSFNHHNLAEPAIQTWNT